MEEAVGTGMTKATITTTRLLEDIMTDGTRAKGIPTGIDSSIAGNIITVIGITVGGGIAIETGITTITGIIGGERIAGLDQGTEDSMGSHPPRGHRHAPLIDPSTGYHPTTCYPAHGFFFYIL
jgi:hypothetical protein